MANTSMIQMLGNSACFSLSSEDSEPALGAALMVGMEWEHQPREAGAGAASAALLSQQQLKIALASP